MRTFLAQVCDLQQRALLTVSPWLQEKPWRNAAAEVLGARDLHCDPFEGLRWVVGQVLDPNLMLLDPNSLENPGHSSMLLVGIGNLELTCAKKAIFSRPDAFEAARRLLAPGCPASAAVVPRGLDGHAHPEPTPGLRSAAASPCAKQMRSLIVSLETDLDSKSAVAVRMMHPQPCRPHRVPAVAWPCLGHLLEA